jgi:hypothetical protein
MQTHYPDKWLKVLLLSVLLPTAALADDGFSDVEIKTQKAGNGVYMLTGQCDSRGRYLFRRDVPVHRFKQRRIC